MTDHIDRAGSKKRTKGPTRRDFVITATSFMGGLMVACKTREGGSAKGIAETIQSIVAIEFPNAWIAISDKGDVVFTLDKVEMGQGTMTTLASIVAEEIGVDTAAVKVKFAPVGKAYANNVFLAQVTGGSNSIISTWRPLRLAAAATRDMLIEGGAQQMKLRDNLPDLKAKDCVAKDGKIVHSPTGNSIGIGEIAAYTAKNIKAPKAPIPKPQNLYKVLGNGVKRLDSPEKVLGRAHFGIDTSVKDMGVEDMVIAVVKRIPQHGGKVVSYNAAAAEAYLAQINVKGEIRQIASGVAVATRSYWFSKKAADLIELTCSGGAEPKFDGSMKTWAEAQGLVTAKATEVRKTGNAAMTWLTDSKKLESFYELPYAQHASLEPQNATAKWDGKKLEIWVGTQAPDASRGAAARASGVSEGNITVHTTYMGGAFGRRISQDFVADAAELAVKLNKNVKVIFSREDDTNHDFYRPGIYNVMRGSIGGNGRINTWSHRIIGQSIAIGVATNGLVAATPSAIVGNGTINFLGRVVEKVEKKGLFVDTFVVEGAKEVPYTIPNILVEYRYEETGIPIGFWRSVGHSHNGFVVESFVDELAALAGKDPYQFRVEQLGNKDRELGCLRKVAEMAQWGQAPADAGDGLTRAKGIASHACFESFCAQVVQIAMKGDEVRVEKVWVALDCGLALNPDIVRQQIEGSIVWALTAAFKQKITFANGATQGSGRFGPGNELVKINEMPEIIIELLNATSQGLAPTGVGEVAVPALAPALCNAITKIVGEKRRPRSMPLSFKLLARSGAVGTGSGTGTGSGDPTGANQQLIKDAYASLDKNCVTGCHVPGDNANAHDSWTSLDKLGSRVIPGNPDASKLIKKIVNQEMPIDGAGNAKPMPADDLKKLVDWIKAGAPKT